MFDAAIAAAAAASGVHNHTAPILRRTLCVDGDGLAYYCAGNDETAPGTARDNLVSKVMAAKRVSGAENVKLLVTASGSHKGHRYAIARRKVYQGQRANSRRPANWQVLREFMEMGRVPFDVELTDVAEADDLFGKYAYASPEDTVTYTQDKDMRMLPGYHLDWVSHRMHKVEYDQVWYEHSRYVTAHDSVFNDKQYGQRWFWLQMLHGDTADNIPGLPKATMKYGGGPIVTTQKLNPVGEAGAGKVLDAHSDMDIRDVVAMAYRSFYGDRWLVEMLEQACLLWMRRDPTKWDDVLNPGGAMSCFNDGEEEFAKAYLEIQGRVSDADYINAQAKDNASSSSEG